MKINKLFIFVGILAVLIIIIASCKTDGKNRGAPDMIDDDETSGIVEQIENIKNVYHLCPSPAEMLSVIDIEALTFDGDLLSPPGNADQYLDNKSQTLNLGIYITDLAYSALFGRHEETLDYLDVVRSLAEEIRVTGAIDDELIESARSNVEYLDSLFNISNEAFVNMLFFCERNNRPNTIILLSAGAFIESMYLAINLVEDFDKAGQIIQHLAEQKYAIDNLILFAETLQAEDDNVAAVIKDLQPIKAIYDRIVMSGGTTTVQKGESNKLVIGGGSKPTLERADFEALSEATITLRNEIIGN
jgi:hypothetical protein